ncbi:zip homologous protein 2-like [Uranotaenia lowii]|uniref:zip homologous protein 2-like n=1 Tax=Uranotaenia lowii TaxID=190385 RepID=UPI00247ADED8|nr:zip homologous protein 2-like [Uranotaenia lowii]
MLVFCELCFKRPNDVGKMFISSCQHMFCRICAESSTDCTVCKKPCRILEIIRGKIPDAVVDCFEPISNDVIQRMIKRAKFQSEKMDIYIAAHSSIFDKYEEAKKGYLKIKGHYDDVKRACNEEIELIQKLRLKRKPRKLPPNVTPSSVPSGVYTQMRSLRISTLEKNHNSSQVQCLKRNRSSSSDSSFISRKATPTMQSPNDYIMKRFTASSDDVVFRKPLPIDCFKKPLSLLETTKPEIYQETMRSMESAFKRPESTVVKGPTRAGNVERARNIFYS